MENPECDACNGDTKFVADVPDTTGISCVYRCVKCGFFNYIQHLKEWIH